LELKSYVEWFTDVFPLVWGMGPKVRVLAEHEGTALIMVIDSSKAIFVGPLPLTSGIVCREMRYRYLAPSDE